MKLGIHIQKPKIYLLIAITSYLCFIVSTLIYQKKFTVQNAANTITLQLNNQINEFKTFINEPILIENLIENNKIDYPALRPIKKTEYWLYILNDSSKHLVYWNNSFIDSIEYKQLATNSFWQNALGTFYVKKENCSFKNKTYIAIALLPILKKESTNNQNSKEVFAANSQYHKFFAIGNDKENTVKPTGSINSISLYPIAPIQNLPYNNYHLFFLVLALLSGFTALHLYTKNISKHGRFGKGLLILVSSITLFRLLLYLTDYPFLKSAMGIFDPTIYASNAIHSSLGDLLMNAFFVGWLMGYLQHLPLQKLTQPNKLIGHIIASLSIALYIIVVFASISILASLIKDSQISFNVLDFYSLDEYSFLAACCMSFICIIIARFGYVVVSICNFFKIPYLFQIFIIFCICGSYILFFENETNYWYLNLVFIWILVRLLTLTLVTRKKPMYKFDSKLVLNGILIYSLSCAFFGLSQITILEKKQRTNLAQRIALEYNNFNTDSITNSTINFSENSIVKSNPKYSFAIYKNNFLVQHHGDVSFATEKQFASKPDFAIRNGINLLSYPINNSTGIVITTKSILVLSYLTLFNYIFIIFLVIGISFSFYYVILARGKQLIPTLKVSFQQIRTQLLALIILSGIGVFTLISVVMYNYFTDQYKTKFQSKLLSAIAPIQSVVSKNGTSFSDSLKNKINESFFIYNIDGSLLYSNLTSETNHQEIHKLPFEIFKTLNVQKQDFVIDNWYTNNSTTSFIYKALKNSRRHTLAFLAIPYKQAKAEQQQEISNFITALLNIIIIIFILGFTIAFLFANRITKAFGIVANNMKLVSFNGTNELITYTKNNEIKVLIDEYNSMVGKLNDSAIALAKSEREGAWKEMARQVAHEIKNPLTPMKLSLQYLQRAIKNNQPNVQELAYSVSNTLTQQIDQLAKIANDFSQFANIHNINATAVDLHKAVQDVVTLFTMESSVNISLTNEAKEGIVFADAIQLNRLFTNLIKNGIEALSEIENPTIQVSITNNTTNNVLVSITDNGTGITETNKEKIFTPNFTTKSSGTGLGLAICKGIVENAGGAIWFANNSVGVSFFVEFPLLKN